MSPAPVGGVADQNRLPARWLVLGALSLTSFIGTWDVASPTPAVPVITREFHVGIDSAVWVLTIEQLMFAVPMAIFGKLGDLYGYKRTYLISTGAFAAFTALAATTRHFGWLIFFRALQGLASSPGYTATMALIGSTFPAEERGRAMGMQGMAAALGWAIGPILGGLLLLAFRWQVILWIEIPLAVLACGLAWRLMPEDSRASRPQFDLAGAASLTASALALMIGLRLAGESGWASGPALAMAGLFVGLIGVFLFVEARHTTPFVPLALFANVRLAAATIFSVTQIIIMLAMTLLVPVYLQEVNGADPATAGLYVTALSTARVLFAPLAGRLAELHGSRLPSLAGLGLLFALALGFMLWLSPLSPRWAVLAGMFAFGAGISFSRIPVNAAVTHLVDRESLGLALGVFSMFTFAGGSLGQTFFGVLLRTLSGAGNAPLATAARPDLLGAFAASFGVVVALAGLAALIGLRLPGREMVRDGVSVRR